MNGPTALPIQYAESIMALTVTLFVWPAVTLESQDNDSTKLVVPTPAQVSKSERDSYKDPHQWATGRIEGLLYCARVKN